MASKRANSGDEQQQKLSPSGLPIREIPGSYGVPFFSPLRDRLDYFYFQGEEEYFRSRIAKHGGATVLRVNMPPGPFISGDSRVVAVLDARCFRVLLDDSVVDKDGALDGTYMPSLALFGGYRPLAFLDGADPRHAAIKRVVIRLAAARMHHVAPAFGDAFAATFDAVEAGLSAASGAAGVEFNEHNMRHMLDFTCAALFGGRLPSKAIGDGAADKAYKWLVFQLHPIASKAIKPWPLEELLLHTFRLPPFLVRGDYADLTAYFAEVAAGVLDDAEEADPGAVPRDELLHNLIFVAIFNAYGGFKIFLPHVVKWLARSGPELHARLADEVRAVVPLPPPGTGSTGGGGGGASAITLSDVEKMPLVKSVVWEALRMNPPVAFQYGRARRDTVVESHDAAYEVKKGEMVFGYQPLATRDERVFQRGGEFVPDRFATCSDDDERRRLLEHVVWSNGPETGAAAEGNKQCPGKNMVVAVGRLMVAELFRRYDTFVASVEEAPLEPVVTFTSLTRASSAAGHGSSVKP